MRIAQVAPIWNKIPPPLYGGTERVVHALTEGLVKRGHDVTLFASGDSETSARLVSTVPKSLYSMGVEWDNELYPMLHITNVYDQADKFDIIHMHLTLASDFLSFPLSVRETTPSVFTLHFRIKSEDEEIQSAYRRVFLKYKDLNFVSISNSQRTIPINFVSTVYNGIPIEDYTFSDVSKENYIAWIGRISAQKGTKEAITVAKRLGLPIRLTGKVDTQDKKLKAYFEKEVEPLIDNKNVKFSREMILEKKAEFYRNAKVFLFPLAWSEPFGLVMTEAMSCGTPVVAYSLGSVAEVVKDGVTGFVVPVEAGIEGLCRAVKRIYAMAPSEYSAMRHACRRQVEEQFSVEKMIDGYEEVYKKILS